MLGFAEHWNRNITDKCHFPNILFVELTMNFLFTFGFPFIVYDERRQPSFLKSLIGFSSVFASLKSPLSVITAKEVSLLSGAGLTKCLCLQR